jgi:hypothetical protein
VAVFPDSLMSFSGYNVVSRDRYVYAGAGDGVAIYVADNIWSLWFATLTVTKAYQYITGCYHLLPPSLQC